MFFLPPTLSVITGDSLVSLLVWLIVFGLIAYILWWAISKIPMVEPVKTIVTAIFALIVAIVLINLLLGLVDHQFIKF